MDVFQTLIVPASVVVQARSVAAETPGCDGMFTTPLSPSGAAPATHYISSGYITEDLVLAIPGLDVSSEPPFEAMDRLGLQMITEGAAAPLPAKKSRK